MNIKKLAQQFTNGILIIALGIIFQNQIFAQTQNQPNNQKLFDLNQTNQSQNAQQQMPNNSVNTNQNKIRIRIGIASKNWAATDQQVTGAAGKLKEMLAGADSDIYDAVILQAKLDKAIVDEARKENCNYILYIEGFTSDISISKGGNFLTRGATKIVQSATEAAGRAIINNSPFPTSGVQQVANTTLATAVNQINVGQILQEVTNNTKKKNKVSMTYTLFGFGENNNLLANITKMQTATRDKESILERVLIDVGNEVLNKIPDNNQTSLTSSSNSNFSAPNSAANSSQVSNQNNNTFSQSIQTQPTTAGSQNPASNSSAFVNVTSVELQGLKLGITFEEAKAKNIINSAARAVSVPDKYGLTTVSVAQDGKTKYFLDGKLVEFSISYSGIKWTSINEFNLEFSKKLGLPNNWSRIPTMGAETQLSLNGYYITSMLLNGEATVRITNSTWKETYNQRTIQDKNKTKQLNDQKNEQKKSVWNPQS